jgi:cardiolipin synthase
MSHNYRDHRKITVIDGKTGFTGGLNLADEYVNLVQRFGYLKDTAVKLTGNAVNELTKMFLETWSFTCCAEFSDLNSFKYYSSENNKINNGFIVPFGDSPMSDFSVSKLAYINMINMRKNIFI